jgi:hypothetical protein
VACSVPIVRVSAATRAGPDTDRGVPSQWWRRHFACVAAVAGDMQPMVIVPVGLGLPQCLAHEFAGAQSRAVAQVEPEAHSLSGRAAPAVRRLSPDGARRRNRDPLAPFLKSNGGV